ncbi:hypothetical protein AB0J72_23730 [Dactylosporangium sp. NPDC049742]|uniref:hypothetical protein n=1 Tax=Dactylosporangium sp. NPDC049742 TaxID=3154737 RepID=UPI003437EBB2
MTGWSTWAAPPVSVDLPPGWTVLRTAADDLDAQVTALLLAQLPDDAAPQLRAEVAEQWRQVARVSAAAGAVLAGFGAAADPAAGQLVSASVLVAPQRWYRSDPAETELQGPRDRLRSAAGATERALRLVRAASPLGPLAEVVAEYTVTPPAGDAWTLVFRTPAVQHLEELVAVFDAVAASLRVAAPPPPPADEDDGPAFS